MTVSLSANEPLKQLSDERVDELTRRLKAARALKTKPHRSCYDVELAAEEIGVHASTLYRDIKRLEGRGTVEDLAPRNQGWPEGRSKLHVRQEELINEFLRGTYLAMSKPSMVSVIERIGDACEAEGYCRPSRAAVIRRCEQIPKREIVAKRQGPMVAEQYTRGQVVTRSDVHGTFGRSTIPWRISLSLIAKAGRRVWSQKSPNHGTLRQQVMRRLRLAEFGVSDTNRTSK